MRTTACFFLLIFLGSCRHWAAHPTPAPPPRSTCVVLTSDTLSPGLSVQVRDGVTGEALAGAVVILQDSMGRRFGGHTDVEGNFRVRILSSQIFELNIRYIGFLLAEAKLHVNKDRGMHVIATLNYNTQGDTIWDCPGYPPWTRDPFSPQNTTLEREELRRMPVPR